MLVRGRIVTTSTLIGILTMMMEMHCSHIQITGHFDMVCNPVRPDGQDCTVCPHHRVVAPNIRAACSEIGS